MAIFARKIQPKETLEKLRQIQRNHKNYNFRLVGIRPPNMPLKELGVKDLPAYFLEQAEKYGLNGKTADLQNYCCIFAYKLRKFSEGDRGAIDKRDIDYTMETILALNQKVEGLVNELDAMLKSKVPVKKDRIQEKINETSALLRAMNALSSNAIKKWTKTTGDEKLIDEARRIVAQYRELGFIKL